MFDVLEITHRGDKIIVQLEKNDTGSPELGEYFGSIRLNGVIYAIVSERTEDEFVGHNGDKQVFSLVPPTKAASTLDFEEENIEMVLDQISDSVGEDQLFMIEAILRRRSFSDGEPDDIVDFINKTSRWDG